MGSHNNPNQETGNGSEYVSSDQSTSAASYQESTLGKNSTAFQPGLGTTRRINLDAVYGKHGGETFDIKLGATNVEDILSVELQHNKLYLRTLNTMLREHGYNVTSEQLARQPSTTIFGSQPLLFLEDFSKGDGNMLISRDFFKNESTTPYKFDFNFASNEIGRVSAFSPTMGASVTFITPTMAFDAKAILLLKDHGVSRKQMERHFINHLKMAQFSEHDGTVHQITIPAATAENTKADFVTPLNPELPGNLDAEARATVQQQLSELHAQINPLLEGRKLPQSYSGDYLEDHALAFQTKILRRMFEDVPKRKDYVLQYAAETFDNLSSLQQMALTNCKSNTDRMKVNEAFTYLAETYYHRLARVISPGDADLRKPVAITGTDGTVKQISVADAANGLISGQNGATLITPKQLRRTLPKNSIGALDILEHHSSVVLGHGGYRAIHQLDQHVMTAQHQRPRTAQELSDLELKHDAEQRRLYPNGYEQHRVTFNAEEHQFIPSIKELHFANTVDALATFHGIEQTLPRNITPSKNLHIDPPKVPVPAVPAMGIIGIAYGGYGLYQQYSSPTFQQDIAAGGTRAFNARMSLLGNTAAVGLSGSEIAVQTRMISSITKGAGQLKGLPSATQFLGPGGIAVALAAGAFEVAAAGEAGDGHRQARVGGQVVGGITGSAVGVTTSAAVIGFLEGICATTLAGAEVGSFVPGWGTAIGAGAGLVVGIGGALIGGEVGGSVGDKLLGDYLQGKQDAAAVKQMQEMQQALASVSKQSLKDVNWAHYDFKQINVVQKTRSLLQKRLEAERLHERQNPPMIVLLEESVKQVTEVATRLHLPAYEISEEQFNKQHYQQIGKSLTTFYEKHVEQQISSLLPELTKVGWAKILGDKKGALTLNEIKAAFPTGFHVTQLDANLDGSITGKEITDILNQPALARHRTEQKGRPR